MYRHEGAEGGGGELGDRGWHIHASDTGYKIGN